MNIQEEYYKVEKHLTNDEPYYGLVLMTLNKYFDKTNNKTACVFFKGCDPTLDINSDFFEAMLNIGELTAKDVLKHELMHICFFHFDIGAEMFKQDRDLANIAADLSINCYLKNLPAKAVVNGEEMEFIHFDTWAQIFNLEPYKGMKYYWDKLNEQENKKKLQQMLQNQGNGGGQGQINKNQIHDHNFDKDMQQGGRELSDAKRNAIKSQVEFIMGQVLDEVKSSKSKGNIPGELECILEHLGEREPEKFDWRGYLQHFCGRSTKWWHVKSKRKESKRFPDSEGNIKKHHCRVCVLPDTSGSVSDDELREFLSEFEHMAEHKAEVTVTCFDTQVYKPFKLIRGYDMPVFGRGGTDFSEAVNWIIENKRDYDCFIIFTDGFDKVPENTPRDILWVLSSVTSLTPEEFEADNCIKLEL